MNNLKKLQLEDLPGGGVNNNIPPPPPPGAMRNYLSHIVQPPNPYGHFGHPMPMGPGAMGSLPPMGHMGSTDHMNPMQGPFGPYGPMPPPAHYGSGAPGFGHGPPPGAIMPPYSSYGSHNFQAPAPNRQNSLRPNNRSNRSSDTHQSSTALVLRRNDDADIDPETKVWKDLFHKLFTCCFGWASSHCKEITPGAVEFATKTNPRLWEYILKVATCYKDPQAAPKHALFMLNSPDHRLHFISRLLLQYIEQEMLHWKFWLGWDEETDMELSRVGPIIDYIGVPLEVRRDARQKLRAIVEGIVKDDEYARFRSYKTTQHSNRLRDIARDFMGGNVATMGLSHDAGMGLRSMANMGMELSNKVVTSRLSFVFTWNECAVKFCHDSHIALNSPVNGISLQHKHVRIMLVVTPGVSYRDDSGPSIVPRGVTKAQVLIMN